MKISSSIIILLIIIGVLFGASHNNGIFAAKNEITVGVADADIIGSDNLAIQAAVDMMYLQGGGTVRILSGEYILIDAIHLRSNVKIKGSGIDKTILKHSPAGY